MLMTDAQKHSRPQSIGYATRGSVTDLTTTVYINPCICEMQHGLQPQRRNAE